MFVGEIPPLFIAIDLAAKVKTWLWPVFTESHAILREARGFPRYPIIVKGSFMEETPGYGWFCSHLPKDYCVQLACALRDHEVTFSLAQRSLGPVGMCLKED